MVLDQEKQTQCSMEQDKQDVIEKIYLHAKDSSKPKYEYLIKKA